MLQGSLLARTNVVLALAAVAIAAVSLVVINRTVIEPVSERSAENRAALLVLTAREWAQTPPERRHDFEVEVLMDSGIIVANPPLQFPPGESASRYYSSLVEAIETLTGKQVSVREADDLLWVDVPVTGSKAVQVGFASELRDVEEAYVGVMLIVAGAFILLLTSYFLVSWIARPLVHVADAAAAFRGTEPFTPLPEEGPKELQVLVKSFNQMAQDITDLLSNRTVLLAGISHDLRTPLARMRLNLELITDRLETTELNRLSNNIQQMEDLIRQALEFANESHESGQPTCLFEIVSSVTREFNSDIPVQFDGNRHLEVTVAQGALQRVLQNLLANARVHAQDPRVKVDLSESAAAIHVIDEGSGIPEEHRKAVFQPFFRIENARTRQSGGSGLGLAVVSQLCHSQGWNASVCEAKGGGADFSIEIPVN